MKPRLEVLRGGKFDNTSLLREAEKILTKVHSTNDIKFLSSVYSTCERILKDDESLEPEEIEIAENMAAEAAERLSVLGHSVTDQKGGELMDKKEKYNL